MGNTCSVEDSTVRVSRRKHAMPAMTESRAVGTSPNASHIQLDWASGRHEERDHMSEESDMGFVDLFGADGGEGAAPIRDTITAKVIRDHQRGTAQGQLQLNVSTRLAAPRDSTTSCGRDDSALAPPGAPNSGESGGGGSALSVYRNDALSSTKELKSLNSISNATSNTVGPSVGGLTACSVVSMASDMYMADSKRGLNLNSVSRIQFGSFVSSARIPSTTADTSSTSEGCDHTMSTGTISQQEQECVRRSILSTLQHDEESLMKKEHRHVTSDTKEGSPLGGGGEEAEGWILAKDTMQSLSNVEDAEHKHNKDGTRGFLLDTVTTTVPSMKPPPPLTVSGVSPGVSPTHSDLMMSTPPSASCARNIGGTINNALQIATSGDSKTFSPFQSKLDPQTPPSTQNSLNRKRGAYASPLVAAPPGTYFTNGSAQGGQNSCSSGGAIRLQGSGCSIKSLESHMTGSVLSVKVAQLSNGSGRPVRGSFSASISASHPLSIDELSTLNNSVIARDGADGDVSLPCFETGCNFLKGEECGNPFRPQPPKDPNQRRGATSQRRHSADTQCRSTLYSSDLCVEFLNGSGGSQLYLGGEVALNAAAPFQMFQYLDASAAAIGSHQSFGGAELPRETSKSLGSSFGDDKPIHNSIQGGNHCLEVVAGLAVGIREECLTLDEKASRQRGAVDSSLMLESSRGRLSESSFEEYLPEMAPLDDGPCAPLLELF